LSTKTQREIAHKLKVFAHAEQNGNVALTCRYCGISRDTFYRWKKNYKSKGEVGLVNSIILDSYGSVGIYGVITKLRFQ